MARVKKTLADHGAQFTDVLGKQMTGEQIRGGRKRIYGNTLWLEACSVLQKLQHYYNKYITYSFLSRKSSFEQLPTFSELLWEEVLHSRKDLRSEIPIYMILGNRLSFLQCPVHCYPPKISWWTYAIGFLLEGQSLVRNETTLLNPTKRLTFRPH